MFLDDQLLEIGRSFDMSEESPAKYTENVINTIKKMLVACMDNIESNITDKMNYTSICSCFRRVNNTWKNVIDQLKKEGIDFAKREGFEQFVKSKDDLKKYL